MSVSSEPSPALARAAFLDGFGTAWRSVFAYVLVGNYVGIGALSYEFGFSLWWMVLSTLLIWAAPAQVILISTLTTATLLEVAIAVGLSSARFLPMVAALVPTLKHAPNLVGQEADQDQRQIGSDLGERHRIASRSRWTA